MENRFVILICSYNNEKWVQQNLESVICQTHDNWIVVYYNAGSADKTYELAKTHADKDSRIHLFGTPERHMKTWFLERLSEYETIRDNDIVCILDGDDFLGNDEVINYLNEVYNKTNCWITYGGMAVWDTDTSFSEPFPQNTEAPPDVKQNKLYRRDMWRYSHFRTYRGFLWNKIKKEDWTSKETNQYIMIEDLMTMYPCLEMCPPEKIFRIDQPVYILNYSAGNGGSRGYTENKINNVGQIQEIEVRSRPKYPELVTVNPVLAGGLGNQMFEVAAAAALAKDNNAQLLVNPSEHILPNQGRNIHNYLNNVFIRVATDNNPPVNTTYIWESMYYKPIPFEPNIKLRGHFQSWKYFDHHREYLQSLFGPTKEIQKELHERFGWLKDATAVQVRRGDALEARCIGYHPVPTLEYIYSAVDQAKPTRIVVFSDDMPWCRQNLKFDVPCDFDSCQGVERDYLELYMMALCQNIIISNSTFGWWGAYLNNRTDKQVYAPSLWFGPKLTEHGFNINELLLPEWKQL